MKPECVTITISGENGAVRIVKRFIGYYRRWLRSDYNITFRIVEKSDGRE